MELWIRSQDKMTLYKANEIFVESEIINYIETGKHYICVNDEWFGTYKSKERALEVLDEIQEKITQFNVKTDYSCVSNIYEMPNE